MFLWAVRKKSLISVPNNPYVASVDVKRHKKKKDKFKSVLRSCVKGEVDVLGRCGRKATLKKKRFGICSSSTGFPHRGR